MGNQPTKKKASIQKYISLIFFLIIGAFCGVFIGNYMEKVLTNDTPLWKELLMLGLFLVIMYVAILVQIMIHEAGHLIFGLMTGYKFCSFRIMNIMLVKENGTFQLRRLSIVGTGGQCLMAPPDMKDGKIPVALYNFGGAFMNFITGIIFLILYFVTKDIPFLPIAMLLLAIIGFAFAIMNGIPMNSGLLDNDGRNAISLIKNPEALRAFWIQMKVNELVSKGVRLKDMPKEWFFLPSDEAMKNSMLAALGVFSCNHLMDAHCFQEADQQMAHLLQIDSSIAGVHRNLLICDRIYHELIGENRRYVVEQMLSKEQRKFMQAMKTFPSVIRTQYAYALLAERDSFKAQFYLKEFEKCKKSYPYPSELDAEWELIEIAYKANQI